MSLKDEIILAQQTALKAGDSKRLSILRMVASAMKNEEIAEGRPLEDNEIREVIRRQAKQLQDALVDFVKGDRVDLIDQTKFELSILSQYLPAQLSEIEVKEKVMEILSALGPKESLKQGLAMGAVMKELKEVADGNVVRQAVAEYLQSGSV